MDSASKMTLENYHSSPQKCAGKKGVKKQHRQTESCYTVIEISQNNTSFNYPCAFCQQLEGVASPLETLGKEGF